MNTGATASYVEEAEGARTRGDDSLALLVAGSVSEPARIGEVALIPRGATLTLGRGDGDGEARTTFVRQRPGENARTPPLGGAGLSRTQLRISSNGTRLEVTLVGRPPLTHHEVDVERCELSPGDAILVRGQLTLLCVRRPSMLPRLAHFPVEAAGAFGEADRFGMIGESTVAWATRNQVTFAARANCHVLFSGESGTGKELAARATHALSVRAGRPFISRNAATLPSGLIDAELFGHARNYPNAGMQERSGIIGEADGGTLFLDELAELPIDLQSHLLRVLDADGEYQRLGDSTPRRSRFVLVGATNREPASLKHDLLARLPVRIALPPLRDHIEDLPLIARQLLLSAARRSPEIVERFLIEDGGALHPRIHPRLLLALLEHSYPSNVRELDALLWRAMSTSTGNSLTAPPELVAALTPPSEHQGELTEARIRGALEDNGGSVTNAARALGLPSRYALYRWMKKLGMTAP